MLNKCLILKILIVTNQDIQEGLTCLYDDEINGSPPFYSKRCIICAMKLLLSMVFLVRGLIGRSQKLIPLHPNLNKKAYAKLLSICIMNYVAQQ